LCAIESNDHLSIEGLPAYRLMFSLAILSAAIIAFQLALIQILSIVQWHHFAYMVISIALLGFGAAGTFLAFFRKPLLKHINIVLPALMIGCGLVMSLVTGISQLPFFRFDSYLLFADYSHIGKLLFTYLLFFIPFFIGALAIGLIFDRYVARIGKIYFANLAGSGAGGLILLALLWRFFPAALPALIALLPVLAGMLIIPPYDKSRSVLDQHKTLLLAFAFIAIISCIFKIVVPARLQLSEFKDLSKTLLLPDARIKMEKTSPYGLVQAVTSPVLRYAPGLSLTAHQTAQVEAALFLNGDWLGAVTDLRYPDSSFILSSTTDALPYIMAARNDVLVLQSGTGMQVMHAVSNHAKKITAVEPNSMVTAALKKELLRYNDSLFYNPAITVHNTGPRTFLFTDTAHYDLITVPMVGSFGGSAGLYAMHEQFLFTKESFIQMWNRLKEGGAISISAWIDYPARNPLKILSTLVEVLEKLKISHPQLHIAAIKSWATITFVLTRSPLTEKEIQYIRIFCRELQFDPACLPYLQPEERNTYHQLQDSSFLLHMDKLFTAERKALYAVYDFNIVPATDNRPYFSQFIRWKNLPHLASYFGNRTMPFFELGYLLTAVTFIQIAVISFVLIVLPLFKKEWKRKNKTPVLLYFSGIGLGYMFVEMVLIQNFILYFGQPVYAAAAVITSLLVLSGFGSYSSRYFARSKKNLQFVFAAIIVLLLLYSFLLRPVLQQTMHVSMVVKALIVFLLIAPLAFCMGIPFPAGLSFVARSDEGEVAWPWGINGCISVISAVLATMIAVEAGFVAVLLLAALGYCMPLIALRSFQSSQVNIG
jgi:hypothetical protein